MKYKMKVVKLSSISVGERFRVDMGNVKELAEGIKEKGLIQPMCVNEDMVLLAGGRRHAACTLAGLIDVPVLIREGNDEVDAREIELMENIHRKEMTWQEQAKLTARIHSLYQERDPNWSGRKTAQLIEQNPMNVSRALRLAAAMEVLPDLENCKTADEASKIIRKAEDNAIVAELARRQQSLILDASNPNSTKQLSGKEKGIAATLKVADNNYRIGDVFEGLKKLHTNGHIDLIECDPPYGVDLDILTQRADAINVNTRDAEYHEISQEDYASFTHTLCNELYRIAGKDCWMVFWFAFRWHGTVLASLQDAGWQVDAVPALWCKGNGRTPRPDILLARSYEPFFICRKGQPTIIKQGRMNSWTRNADEKKYHPAQRPVGLIEDIFSTFLDERRHNILIPFLGSGASLRACYKMGHEGFGWDSNAEYKKHFMLAVEEDTKKLLSKE